MTGLSSSSMIGDVEVPHHMVLAPMIGVTNSAFRTIAREFGADLVVMGMISEKGLLYNNEKTLHMLHIDGNEHPISIQLFGGDADRLKHAAEFIQENTKADIVNINMDYLVNKVVKNGAGAKWLKDPDKVYHIINGVASVLDIPLTVKMRTGWSDSELAVGSTLAAESAGVSALVMHGRTREQMYTGTCDREAPARISKAITKIPFIRNGDVRSVHDAKYMIGEIGVDAVVVERTVMNNPYIPTQISHYFETGEELPDLPFVKKLDIAKDHLRRLINFKGEKIAVREFRDLAPHYLRSTAGAAKVRGAVSRVEAIDEVKEIFNSL